MKDVTMVPPRLTIVKNTDDEIEHRLHDVAGAGEAAAGTASAHDGSVSPVHDLIASIETSRPPIGDDASREIVVSAVDDERRSRLRVIEAVIFASPVPVDAARLAEQIKASGEEIAALLSALQAEYVGRGVQLVPVAGKWAFRTAQDLSWVLEKHSVEQRRLSKAALETLAIVAYHQPVTRAEIEEIRGVTISKGTLDVLMETGWVKPRGRRRAPGKPMTYGTTEAFLAHFGLDAVKDLPGLAELKGLGLLDSNLPPEFKVPEPTDVAALMPDELPLDDGDDDVEGAQGELSLATLDDDGGASDPDDGLLEECELEPEATEHNEEE
jgi:segregation and condensation protein B